MQVAAQPARAVGTGAVDQAGAVQAVDEQVPLAVDALLGVVVLEGRFAAQGPVQLQGSLHVGLGECARGVDLGGSILVPARPEDQTVVPHHPGVFDLDTTQGRIVELVVDPGAVRAGHGDHHMPDRVSIWATGFGGRVADQVRVAIGDQYVVLIEDEHVPLTVDALGRVVVGQRRIKAVVLVVVDGLLDEGLCVGSYIRDVRRRSGNGDGHRTARVPLAGLASGREESGVGRVCQPFTVGCARLRSYLDSASVGLSGLDSDVNIAVAVVVRDGEGESDDAAEHDRGGDDRDEQYASGQSADRVGHRVSKR